MNYNRGEGGGGGGRHLTGYVPVSINVPKLERVCFSDIKALSTFSFNRGCVSFSITLGVPRI